jgi:AraC family transcriptional regulator
MYIHKRANWEFFAVLNGRCAPVLSDHEQPVACMNHLWLFPPTTPHGWVGENASKCRVAVFHFSSVPGLLERTVQRHGHLSTNLSSTQSRHIARMIVDVTPHYERMTERSLLVFERTLLDLTLMILESYPAERTETKSDFALRKVEASITWYMEHMAQQPKLEEVARAVNVSVRHLRRLFHDVRNESPLAAFSVLRVQRAMELLAQTDEKMETIARKCGFSSSSDFSRVFKNMRNINPDAWRREVLRGCNKANTFTES